MADRSSRRRPSSCPTATRSGVSSLACTTGRYRRRAACVPLSEEQRRTTDLEPIIDSQSGDADAIYTHSKTLPVGAVAVGKRQNAHRLCVSEGSRVVATSRCEDADLISDATTDAASLPVKLNRLPCSTANNCIHGMAVGTFLSFQSGPGKYQINHCRQH